MFNRCHKVKREKSVNNSSPFSILQLILFLKLKNLFYSLIPNGKLILKIGIHIFVL